MAAKWHRGRTHEQIMAGIRSMHSDAAATSVIICPKCSKRAAARVYNHHLKRWEFKHPSLVRRKGESSTTYCYQEDHG